MSEVWSEYDHIRDVCLKIGEARERLRIVKYMPGINQEYIDEQRARLDAVQRDLERQVR